MIEAVLGVFSALLGLAVARTLPDLVDYYSKFCDSGLELAKYRGYGQSACKFYGAHATTNATGRTPMPPLDMFTHSRTSGCGVLVCVPQASSRLQCSPCVQWRRPA